MKVKKHIPFQCEYFGNLALVGAAIGFFAGG